MSDTAVCPLYVRSFAARGGRRRGGSSQHASARDRRSRSRALLVVLYARTDDVFQPGPRDGRRRRRSDALIAGTSVFTRLSS